MTLFRFLVFLLCSNMVVAAELNLANTSWILTSSTLVLFMTVPGLALFYGGLVRSKNVLSILMQCFAITALSSILWFLAAYSLAFSGDGAFIGNLDKFMFSGMFKGSLKGDLPESAFAFFQMTFAIITPALIIGGYAERIKFSAVLLFSGIWLFMVYTPITHWVWGGGWLQQIGLLDFAGGTVVHISAGVGALVSAIVIGNRSGFLKKAMPPHNMTMTMTGAAMLWVGWFGFNGGSALAANGDAAMAILVTHISAISAAFTWMIYEWLKFGKPTALGMATGLVAGLGTITPASGFVGPAGAFVIGIIAGIICFNAVFLLKQKLKIDDSLDVFPVHGVGGIIGTLLVAIFASNNLGIFSGQGMSNTIITQLYIQAIGVLATFIYSAILSYIILITIDKVIGLRVNKEQEQQGLDITAHEEVGYDI